MFVEHVPAAAGVWRPVSLNSVTVPLSPSILVLLDIVQLLLLLRHTMVMHTAPLLRRGKNWKQYPLTVFQKCIIVCEADLYILMLYVP